MDVQNAGEPIPTKPASPKRPGSEPDQPAFSTVTKSPNNTKHSAATKLAKPTLAAPSAPDDGDAGADGNSDAETIVLPGKDGHSPSKVRKIKNEDKGDGADHVGSAGDLASVRRLPNNKQDRSTDRGDIGDKVDRADKASLSAAANWPSDATGSPPGPKRKSHEKHDKPRSKDGSSGLSSVPTSPRPHPRRRPSHPPSDSDSEPSHSKSPTSKMKPSAEKIVSHKRKAAAKAESEDEAESRKVRRQRTSGSGLDASRSHRDTKLSSKPHPDSHPSLAAKSASPPPRTHRRSASTQLPSHSSNGLSQKKKRIPAPLRSTDYHSDESSASGSPHPRSSKLRSLTTPATAESTTSPAKMAPHKKHLDAHGQTFLARACARGEYDVAKQRLEERPEDIDVADYAGNTPLQIASINGCEDIVKLLVDAGCSLDCVNYDKDTPLLDAVDNGHLDVIKVLLAAGVNPRKANAYGQEPIDRVSDDQDNAEEIKKVLQEAREKMGERRRTSEDHHPQENTDARSSHGPESPRQSPGAPLLSHAASSSRRAGTVRSTKTSNHLLYMPMDDKTLRSAAARGDEETVTRILQVRDTFDDPESMVAAARGGHDIVMQLLLALGRANPDPGPISSTTHEFSTPMLAAIGQENIKVVRLLLDQTDFDPTRRFKGESYYEIARRRRGPNWMEEEHMLKNAYDEYRRTHKDSSKTKSPIRREQEREARRQRAEPREDLSGPHKRKATSPTRENKKAGLSKGANTSPKEKRRSNSFANQHDDQASPKRGPGRPRKEDRLPTIAITDREASPAASKHVSKPKRTESDVALSSEGESMKPRRKLVSRRELKGEREKRRGSVTSNASSLKEPTSPHDSRHDGLSEKYQKSEKYHDRTKALKRDESREKASSSGENPGKRHRSSATPPRLGSDKDGSEAPVKKRRLEVVESKEKRQKTSSSPDDRPPKLTSTRDAAGSSTSGSGSKSAHKDRADGERRASSKPRKPEPTHEHGRKELAKAISDKSIHVKSEDPDVEMPDAPKVSDSVPDRVAQDNEEPGKQRQPDLAARAQETRNKEDERERKRREDEEKERESAQRRKEEEEAARRAEEEKRQREEAERKRKEAAEEEERKRKAEEERKRREEEERKQHEEEERKRLEEEAKRKREEEERRQREEEERKKREEEERLRKEQLEREAAEEARRKKEEERKEQERKERAHREEMERRRAAREAEQRRIRLEQERARLAKLPPLLRWLDGSSNSKAPEVADKFSMMQGVRYDCISPAATGTPDGREQWLLNTQVALLLGEKDLELSRCKHPLPLYPTWCRRNSC